MKFPATFFSASKRFGFKSLASIDPETSIAMTMSIPCVDNTFVLLVTLCGRANATTMAVIAKAFNTQNTGISRCNLDFLLPNPRKELMVKAGFCLFLFLNQNQIYSGTSSNNHRNNGLKKLIFSIILDSG